MRLGKLSELGPHPDLAPAAPADDGGRLEPGRRSAVADLALPVLAPAVPVMIGPNAAGMNGARSEPQEMDGACDTDRLESPGLTVVAQLPPGIVAPAEGQVAGVHRAGVLEAGADLDKAPSGHCHGLVPVG